MSSDELRQQLLGLLDAMNEALDKQRWRKMPALHQRLMQVFAQYRAQETSQAALDEMKQTLHNGFQQILERRRQRAALLQNRMASHRDRSEGMLAYSMVNLVSEQS
ncbi:flagellar protein FliT [Dryocola sp. BD626]|uniref:flagellar protein FliT n=1 Tax=Dryocola sp. BD626 TaxID=3133273 RepID=UPI003F4FC645